MYIVTEYKNGKRVRSASYALFFEARALCLVNAEDGKTTIIFRDSEPVQFYGKFNDIPRQILYEAIERNINNEL